MDYLAAHVLAFIKAHAEWAAFVIGLVAFGESLVFLSLLFPGTTILVASGVLIDAGILDPVSTMLAGIAGAVLGDAIHSGWARSSDRCLQMFGRFGITLNALRAESLFLSAMAQPVCSSAGSSVLYALSSR